MNFATEKQTQSLKLIERKIAGLVPHDFVSWQGTCSRCGILKDKSRFIYCDFERPQNFLQDYIDQVEQEKHAEREELIGKIEAMYEEEKKINEVWYERKKEGHPMQIARMIALKQVLALLQRSTEGETQAK